MGHNTFGRNLKALRIKNGMTQTELAKILDMNYMAISAYESGHREPTIGVLSVLCSVFKISSDALIGNVNGGNKSSVLLEYLEDIKGNSPDSIFDKINDPSQIELLDLLNKHNIPANKVIMMLEVMIRLSKSDDIK